MYDYSGGRKALSKLSSQKANLSTFKSDRDILGQEYADLRRNTSGIFATLGLGIMGLSEVGSNLESASDLAGIEGMNIVDERNWFQKAFGLGDITYGPENKSISFESASELTAMGLARGKIKEFGELTGAYDDAKYDEEQFQSSELGGLLKNTYKPTDIENYTHNYDMGSTMKRGKSTRQDFSRVGNQFGRAKQ